MNCPVCDGVRMREVEKDGIMIDVCPSCKGVWLDRGELDKLLAGVREMREPFNQWYDEYEDRKYRREYENKAPYPDSREGGYYDPKYKKYKKKKSFMDVLGDLFD